MMIKGKYKISGYTHGRTLQKAIKMDANLDNALFFSRKKERKREKEGGGEKKIMLLSLSETSLTSLGF